MEVTGTPCLSMQAKYLSVSEKLQGQASSGGF